MHASTPMPLPEPLVPPEVDLRDYPYTPIIRSLLFQSTFHAKATDGEWRAGMTLWLKSWEQVPCGTLPDDDVELCRLAEFGRDLKAWRKVKDRAMHKWFKCSDGRLHHEIVAEGVMEAWATRRSNSRRGKAGATARWGRGGRSPEALPGRVPAHAVSNASSIAPANAPGSGDSNAPGNARADAQALPADGNRRELEEKGRDLSPKPPLGTEPPTAEAIIVAFDASRTEIWGLDLARPWRNAGDHVHAQRWIDAGATVAICRGVFDALNQRWKGENGNPPDALKAFEKWIGPAIRDAQKRVEGAALATSAVAESAARAHGDDVRWRARLKGFAADGSWLDAWGPKPGAFGCGAPAALVHELVGATASGTDGYQVPAEATEALPAPAEPPASVGDDVLEIPFFLRRQAPAASA